MRIWNSTLGSICSVMGAGSQATPVLDDAVADIRRSMSEALGRPVGVAALGIARRIESADDLQELWYLRADLMVVLAALKGEAKAREVLFELSSRFHGLLPRAFSSRHSPLETACSASSAALTSASPQAAAFADMNPRSRAL